ncbi:hypothetical protein [Pontibacter mangrovi]|uniref:Uncharacterized protein n=1 Tax=Pontibacter mangrovi TaxID=2589816 RepID=A0A501WDU2_9BACT|nr:hypothetical protein [Pontibacter mangrovi]TPE45341.1 hypothetical protein FJM65_04700 [Pontibacter mangrovi]
METFFVSKVSMLNIIRLSSCCIGYLQKYNHPTGQVFSGLRGSFMLQIHTYTRRKALCCRQALPLPKSRNPIKKIYP